MMPLSRDDGTAKSRPPGAASERAFVGPELRPLGQLDVVHGDLAGTAVLGGVKGDLLPFREARYTGALKSRRVDKDVLAAAVRLNEAEALLVVEKLNSARVHWVILRLQGA